MTPSKKNKGLGNPALIAAAQSPAGQKAINNQTELAGKAIAILPTVIKIAGFGIAAYLLYSWLTNRFKPIGIANNLDPANITDGQAQTKANAIYQAMVGVGANFDIVKSNLAGLNYNGWVKVYNAFGKRQGILPFSAKTDLAEWLVDQFNDSELNELRFLLGDNLF